MNKYLKLILRIAISGLFIYFLLKKIDIYNIINTLKQFKIIHVAIMLIVMGISLITTYLSIIVLSNMKKLSWSWHFIRSYLLSMAFGALSPARLGDFSFAYFIRKKIPMGKGMAILFANKIITITLAIAISIIGAAFLFFNSDAYLIIGGAFILFCIIALIIKYAGRYIMDLRPIKKIGFLNEFGSAIKEIFTKTKGRVAASYSIMFVKFCIDASLAYFLLRSFGMEISLGFSIFVCSVSLLISLIPFTLNGFGVRETTLAYIFTYAKLDPVKGVTIFFAIVMSYYALVALIPLLILRETKEAG